MSAVTVFFFSFYSGQCTVYSIHLDLPICHLTTWCLSYLIAACHTIYAEIFASGIFLRNHSKTRKTKFRGVFIFAKAQSNVGGMATRGSFPDMVRNLVA